MKRILVFLCLVLALPGFGQEADTSQWNFAADLNGYAFEGGDKLLLPVFKADRGWLHLEARYNYEDMQTFSGWVGYNWESSLSRMDFVITPMVGIATGNTKGFLAGFEATFQLGKFELYSETEHLWDAASSEYNFFYTWTDLTYSPKEWWWVGLSAQRTRLYATDLELQRGFILGLGAGPWSFTGYLYNWGMGEAFGLLTVEFEF
ncbi:MAG: hypothetical protein JNN04_15210 [Cyclobacteriaceae bacterium]|nr:hypothetical protein [Cyclobacteriaceae bacterium]